MQFNYARKEGVFYMNQIPVEANKTPVYFVVPGVMNLCKFPHVLSTPKAHFSLPFDQMKMQTGFSIKCYVNHKAVFKF